MPYFFLNVNNNKLGSRLYKLKMTCHEYIRLNRNVTSTLDLSKKHVFFLKNNLDKFVFQEKAYY